jgi:hypothetical protein
LFETTDLVSNFGQKGHKVQYILLSMGSFDTHLSPDLFVLLPEVVWALRLQFLEVYAFLFDHFFETSNGVGEGVAFFSQFKETK